MFSSEVTEPHGEPAVTRAVWSWNLAAAAAPRSSLTPAGGRPALLALPRTRQGLSSFHTLASLGAFLGTLPSPGGISQPALLPELAQGESSSLKLGRGTLEAQEEGVLGPRRRKEPPGG